jgi:FkbM family methyltransferase
MEINMRKVEKILLNLIPIKKWRKYIRTGCANDLSFIKIHPKSASLPNSMKPFAEWVERYTKIKVNNIFEIGANYGQDAAGLAYLFNVTPKNVYTFEAHPDLFKEIKNMYEFNVYNNAVFDEDKTMIFNIVDINTTDNTGVSSLLSKNHNSEKMKQVSVEAIRMDNFMDKHNIHFVDFLKLDVEGCNWEVLNGFGCRLKDVKIIHIEAEHETVWNNQKLYKDIELKLQEFDFELVLFQRYYSQSDSLWVQRKYLNSDLKK